MSAKHVVVVGAGVAGTAAAISARRAGAQVTLVDGGTGATTLAPGAIDDAPWSRERVRFAMSDDARFALDALDAFAIDDATLLATTAGIVRPARGSDRALLDLSKLTAGTVIVPRLEHGSWDANALSRAWNEDERAQARELTFVACDAHLTRFSDEHAMPDADLAARHDDPARLAWLAERLRELKARVTASRLAGIVLPPWLGIERARAADLSRSTGVPCGEALVGVGSPSGLRFERARDRALSNAKVHVTRGRVTRVESNAKEAVFVHVEEGEPIQANAVVLAMGGLVGGGIDYEPSASMLAGPLPPRARPTFRVAIDVPATIGAHARPLDLPGSLFGAPPEVLAWPFTNDPLLERAGVLAANGSIEGAPEGLFAAGDLVADRARTWLAALENGARVGGLAAS